eukprot:TRINITY_DN7193_c0_g1_i1.p1 TRINITY_DN7193_c0_g1~~TRINITY_DN7193_c0_g1_i1.p1  ORF type:complete len:148 (+),score=27.63 TRINITY_DN7193_c0_g1_i1:53-496(+)
MADEFGSWIGAAQNTNDSPSDQIVDPNLVGEWKAATNLATTFDLAVHNLWTLSLQSDGSFQLVGVETVTYPRSGSPSHQKKQEIMSGKWTFSASSSMVTLIASSQYQIKLSILNVGGNDWKRLEIQGFLPSVAGPMGGSPVFSMEPK